MRILYLHQYFATRAGSTGTRSYEFARRWVREGHQVTVITSVSEKSALDASRARITRQSIDGIELLLVNTAYSSHMSFRRRALAFFAFMFWATWVGLRYVGKVDVVFATSTPLTIGIPGYVLSCWKRAPFVFEIRDLWPEAPIQLGALRNPVAIVLARGLERFLYRVAAHIVTLSPAMSEALECMGVPKAKLSMIPNCADLDIFAPKAPDPELVDKYHLVGKFIYAYAGPMGKINGLAVVIEAARVLQNRGEEEIHFVLIGDGQERPHLEQLCAQYQLRNVTFLPPMPKSQLAELLPVAKVCLAVVAPYPILETNSQNKFFDALALGRPVFINYGGWMKDVLEEHRAGIALLSNDPEVLAEKFAWLRAQPEWLAEMGRNARRLAEDEYDRDKLALKLEDVLRSAVRGQGRVL